MKHSLPESVRALPLVLVVVLGCGGSSGEDTGGPSVGGAVDAVPSAPAAPAAPSAPATSPSPGKVAAPSSSQAPAPSTAPTSAPATAPASAPVEPVATAPTTTTTTEPGAQAPETVVQNVDPPDDDGVAAVPVKLVPAEYEPEISPGPAAVAPSGSTACKDIDLRGVGSRGAPYNDGELACFRDTALNLEPLDVSEFTDIQVAAIGLYNVKDRQWQKGVERALSYSELLNAPNLNFAGIKPAYDQGRYSTVVKRCNVVWNNLDKGYRLSNSDRTYVAEFACRAGVQNHMQGTISADHERWCRIWTERLAHEGADATEAQRLLEQVE